VTNFAIVYSSKHGTTAQVAGLIAQHLGGAALIDLRTSPHPDLDLVGCDRLAVGGPIYAGRPDKPLRAFLQAEAGALLARPLALFACGMEADPAKREAQLELAFPEALRAHALGTWFCGGAFCFDRMTRLERAVIKKVKGVTESVTALDADAIASVAAALR
jgi:menaquinone-dependent protoporphyrinogen oxidase